MTLSFVIPIYNCENTLPQCVESILAVLNNEDELLLIDDGSTDGGGRICQQYADRDHCVRYIYQSNSGPSVARNRGISEAAGDYIAFVDADDYIIPEAFIRYRTAIEDLNETADIWGNGFYLVTAGGDTASCKSKIAPTEKPEVYEARDKQFNAYLADRKVYWTVPRYLLRRDFLVEHGIVFPAGYHCAEDTAFATHAFSKAQRIGLFHEPYYCYVTNTPGSLSKRYSVERVNDLLQMLKQFMDCLSAMEDSHAAQCMLEKLQREFLICIAMIYDVPAINRPLVFRAYQENLHILKEGTSIRYLFSYYVLSCVGMRFAGMLLYAAKIMKRRIRSVKRKICEKLEQTPISTVGGRKTSMNGDTQNGML